MEQSDLEFFTGSIRERGSLIGPDEIGWYKMEPLSPEDTECGWKILRESSSPHEVHAVVAYMAFTTGEDWVDELSRVMSAVYRCGSWKTPPLDDRTTEVLARFGWDVRPFRSCVIVTGDPRFSRRHVPSRESELERVVGNVYALARRTVRRNVGGPETQEFAQDVLNLCDEVYTGTILR